MKARLIIGGNGPLLVLSSHESATETVFLRLLNAKGIDKFIAYDLPLPTIRESYGLHFETVMKDLHESDDLRVLDYNGYRIFQRISFKELPAPIYYEPDPGEKTRVFLD